MSLAARIEQLFVRTCLLHHTQLSYLFSKIPKKVIEYLDSSIAFELASFSMIHTAVRETKIDSKNVRYIAY